MKNRVLGMVILSAFGMPIAHADPHFGVPPAYFYPSHGMENHREPVEDDLDSGDSCKPAPDDKARYYEQAKRCLRGEKVDYNAGVLGPCAGFFQADLTGRDFWKETEESGDNDLRGSLFQGATLDNAKFFRVRLDHANFAYTKSMGYSPEFPEAKLTGAKFTGAYLGRANFYAAILREAQMQGGSFSGATFQKAFLYEANLENSDFRHANFRDADLVNTNFRGADLRGSRLDGAETGSGTDFRNARLQGAHLPSDEFLVGNLLEGKFKGATFDDRTVMPFSREKAEKHGMIYVAKGVKIRAVERIRDQGESADPDGDRRGSSNDKAERFEPQGGGPGPQGPASGASRSGR